MSKRFIRGRIRAQRAHLADFLKRAYDKKIRESLDSWLNYYIFKNMRPHILAYVPIQGEVDILPLLKKWVEQDMCELLLPCVFDGEDSFVPVKWDLEDPLSGRDRYGIPVPLSLERSSQSIDLMLLPMLAFNSQGHRLGYGAGCYDRFLEQNNPLFSIGLAYSYQMTDHFSVFSHDQPLNVIITESQVYTYKNR